jgi:hypothetical protein
VIPSIDSEIWLLERLRSHSVMVDPFDGDTDVPERAERIRQAIIEHELAQVIAGRGKDKRPRTFAQTFEQLYGKPLEPTSNKGK